MPPPKEQVDGVLSAFIADAANNGVSLTTAEVGRLRASITTALDRGVPQDSLVRETDDGKFEVAGQGFEDLLSPSTVRVPSGISGSGALTFATVDVGEGGTRDTTIDDVITTITNITNRQPNESSDIAGGNTPAAQAALAAAGLISQPVGGDERAPDTVGDAPATDLTELVSQNQAVIAAYLADLMDPATYSDLGPEDRAFLIAQAQGALGGLIDNTIALQEIGVSGELRLDDGTVLTTELLTDPDLVIRAQAVQAFAERLGSTIAERNQMMLDAGLEDFVTEDTSGAGSASAAARERNQLEQARFANDLAKLGAELDIKDATTRRIDSQVARHLGGLQESRARTSDTLDTILRALPLASASGKTAFTANELGGGVSALARMGGIDPNASLLQFTGQQTIAPDAHRAAGDAALGVSGPVPTVPDLGSLVVPTPPALTPTLGSGGGGGAAPAGAPNILSFLGRANAEAGAIRSGASTSVLPPPNLNALLALAGAS